jgi:hypothetical protein
MRIYANIMQINVQNKIDIQNTLKKINDIPKSKTIKSEY